MAQTTAADYGFSLTKAQAGQKYDIRPDTVMSFAADEAIDPGQPVKRGDRPGTDPEKEVLVGGSTNFLGIALFTHTLEQAFPAGGASYAIGDTVPVLTSGAAYVTSSVDAVNAGDTAYVTAAGTYTNVESTNLAIGTFLTGGDTGDIVVVELA